MQIIDIENTVISDSGKILHFGLEKFVKDIVTGDCCFICGASNHQKQFNDEHVIPNWIIKKYDLSARKIILPNGETFPYSQYKIPCCAECNLLMGERIEKPIRELVTKGIGAITQHIINHGFKLFFVWFNLLYLKTHLKDQYLRFHLNSKSGQHKIGDYYDWSDLHHIHCIARSFYTDAEIDSKSFGSIIVLSAIDSSKSDHFDYGDLYSARSIFLRLGDILFISVLDDSCMSLNINSNEIKRITGPLNDIQYREVFCKIAYANLKIKNRPKYISEFNIDESQRIVAELPDRIEMNDYSESEYGGIMYYALQHYFDNPLNVELQKVKKYVEDGNYTFLFDSSGMFIDHTKINSTA